MEEIKISDFLKRKTIKPLLYGAFLSRIMTEEIYGKKYFYAYSSFRKSKAVYQTDFDIYNYAEKYKNQLNLWSGYDNWSIKRKTKTSMELRFYLHNDLNLTITQFYTYLFHKLFKNDWATDYNLNDNKRSFIRGFLELRGSVDTTANYMAQDYFYNNENELQKAFIITDQMKIPTGYLNFNLRELQPQYVKNIQQRNTQFRINAMYYAKNIGFLNKYKAKIFKESKNSIKEIEKNGIIFFDCILPASRQYNLNFRKRINFYINNIYSKNINENMINYLRKQGDYKIALNSSNLDEKRDYKLIEICNDTTEDKCMCCGTTQTSTDKNTGRQRFQIHHMISFKNGKEFDTLSNLVKLCPTCHDSLKKNASTKQEQTENIKKILNNWPPVKEFCSTYFDTDSIEELAEKVWEMLG